MYRAYLMRDQVGQQFPGTVSAVTSFGAFVEIEEPFVEGLIKLDSLGEPFEYDEVHMRLSGKRTGRTIELGDKVDRRDQQRLGHPPPDRLHADRRSRSERSRRRASRSNPRAGVPQRKKAGREVERAQLGRVSAVQQTRRGASGRQDAARRLASRVAAARAVAAAGARRPAAATSAAASSKRVDCAGRFERATRALRAACAG